MLKQLATPLAILGIGEGLERPALVVTELNTHQPLSLEGSTHTQTEKNILSLCGRHEAQKYIPCGVYFLPNTLCYRLSSSSSSSSSSPLSSSPLPAYIELSQALPSWQWGEGSTHFWRHFWLPAHPSLNPLVGRLLWRARAGGMVMVNIHREPVNATRGV